MFQIFFIKPALGRQQRTINTSTLAETAIQCHILKPNVGKVYILMEKKVILPRKKSKIIIFAEFFVVFYETLQIKLFNFWLFSWQLLFILFLEKQRKAFDSFLFWSLTSMPSSPNPEETNIYKIS